MNIPNSCIFARYISDIENNEKSYDKYNMLALRNTSIGNILPMCSMTIPSINDNLPFGLMLYKPINEDYNLLNISKKFNKIINQ